MTIKKENEVKETKAELFIRLAKPRTQKVLKSMKILGNCSNRNNYEYTESQVDSISSAIQNAVIDLLQKFKPKDSEIDEFEL